MLIRLHLQLFCFVYFVSCVHCYLCLYIAFSWLSLRFSQYFIYNVEPLLSPFYGSRCYQILMSFSSIVWLWCFPYMEILVIFFSDLVQNRIDYVMVRVLASNSADRGFESHSSQSKYYQCCICCVVRTVGLVRKRCENPT